MSHKDSISGAANGSIATDRRSRRKFRNVGYRRGADKQDRSIARFLFRNVFEPVIYGKPESDLASVQSWLAKAVQVFDAFPGKDKRPFVERARRRALMHIKEAIDRVVAMAGSGNIDSNWSEMYEAAAFLVFARSVVRGEPPADGVKYFTKGGAMGINVHLDSVLLCAYEEIAQRIDQHYRKCDDPSQSTLDITPASMPKSEIARILRLKDVDELKLLENRHPTLLVPATKPDGKPHTQRFHVNRALLSEDEREQFEAALEARMPKQKKKVYTNPPEPELTRPNRT